MTATFASGSIDLSWAAPSDGGAPSGYRILRAADDGEEVVLVEDSYDPDADTVSLTHTDAGVTGGEVYRYRVVALNAGGAGAASDAAAVAAFDAVDICDRTEAVRDALLDQVDAVSCEFVPANGLAAVEELNLAWEKISSLGADDFDNLGGLVDLVLKYNDLTTLPVSVFGGLDSLSRLVLEQNKLTTLPVGVFGGLDSLRDLVLEVNDFTTLPEGIFDGLDGLTLLDLCGNPLESLARRTSSPGWTV